MKNRALNLFLLLAALVVPPGMARAQSGDSAVAQALFDEAKQLLANGHAVEACPKLEESERLEPRSGTLINLASCYEQTGRLASAWSKYLEAATAAKAAGNPEREAGAREHGAALASRLSKLMITVAPELKGMPGLEVARDGVTVREPEWGLALPVDPGEHEITAKAPGHESFQSKVTVTGEGQTTTIHVPELTVQAVQSEPKLRANHHLGSARTVALVTGGIGVVGVGLGTAFGLASESKHNQAAPYCVGAACSTNSAVTAANEAHSDGTISTVTMIVGGVGLAAGITLWLTAPKSDREAPTPQVGLGLGTVQVKGAF